MALAREARPWPERSVKRPMRRTGSPDLTVRVMGSKRRERRDSSWGTRRMRWIGEPPTAGGVFNGKPGEVGAMGVGRAVVRDAPLGWVEMGSGAEGVGAEGVALETLLADRRRRRICDRPCVLAPPLDMLLLLVVVALAGVFELEWWWFPLGDACRWCGWLPPIVGEVGAPVGAPEAAADSGSVLIVGS